MENQLHTLAQRHYENFPVGSFLLPKEYRRPIRLVYAFARVADDIADEGNDSERSRLERLDEWEARFERGTKGEAADQFFSDLAGVIRQYAIPHPLFLDLIEAFRMDARNNSYRTFEDVLFYCRHSANPIGRILLHIVGSATEENNKYSDAVCTALQLTNFWQDFGVDIKRNRLYIPQEDLDRFGVTKEDLGAEKATGKMRPLMQFQVDRTKGIFRDGRPLIRSVDASFAFELKMTWHGGVRILEKIEAGEFDTLRHRPVLTKLDWFLIFLRSIRNT